MTDRAHAPTDPAAYSGPERRTQSNAPVSCALAQDHERMLHGHGGERGIYEALRSTDAKLDAVGAKLDDLLAACKAEKEAAVALAKAERRVPMWMHVGYFAAAMAALALFVKRLLGDG